MQKQLFALLHIPKTAGMAIGRALVDALDAKKPTYEFDLCMFGSCENLETMSADVRKRVIDEPRNLTSDTDLVLGHKSLSSLNTAYPSAKLIGIFREPKSRILSHWLYWRAMSEEEIVQWGPLRDFIRVSKGSFKSFLSNPLVACQIDNCATRMLLWPDSRLPDHGYIAPSDDASIIRDAIERMRSLDFLMRREAPDLLGELSAFVGHQLNLKMVNETQPAQGMVPNMRSEFCAETLDLLNQRSRLDLILWQQIDRDGSDDRSRNMESQSYFLRSILSHIQRGTALP